MEWFWKPVEYSQTQERDDLAYQLTQAIMLQHCAQVDVLCCLQRKPHVQVVTQLCLDVMYVNHTKQINNGSFWHMYCSFPPHSHTGSVQTSHHYGLSQICALGVSNSSPASHFLPISCTFCIIFHMGYIINIIQEWDNLCSHQKLWNNYKRSH